jgi:hypothetical protein
MHHFGDFFPKQLFFLFSRERISQMCGILTPTGEELSARQRHIRIIIWIIPVVLFFIYGITTIGWKHPERCEFCQKKPTEKLQPCVVCNKWGCADCIKYYAPGGNRCEADKPS